MPIQFNGVIQGDLATKENQIFCVFKVHKFYYVLLPRLQKLKLLFIHLLVIIIFLHESLASMFSVVHSKSVEQCL